MKNVLNDGIRFVMNRLNSHGKRADIVGGSVRDYLLNKKPYDFDITTDATPDEMREIFSDMKTLDIGIKHGTLTVIYENVPYEITTYRVEREYIDHRHPTSVSFTRSLTDDLARRDFTMNAICYNERDGFTDEFGGREDIENKIIRAVGNPRERFDEDALRIMRALRFSATLGFTIEENTKSALIEKAHLLSFVSRERILSEWRRLICGNYAYEVICDFSSMIGRILGLDKGITLVDKNAFYSLSCEAREVSIFLNEDNPTASFLRFADALGIEKRKRMLGESALSSLFREMPDITELRLSLRDVGVEATALKLELFSAYYGISLTDDVRERLDLAGRLAYKISHLNINGRDLMALGIRGERVGEWLNTLLELVIYEKIENKKEELLAYIKANL